MFEHDIYTVVLAADATLIPEALSLVPEHRRVPANRPLFYFYARMYPGYAVALCCFDNRDAARSDPLLLWYSRGPYGGDGARGTRRRPSRRVFPGRTAAGARLTQWRL